METLQVSALVLLARCLPRRLGHCELGGRRCGGCGLGRAQARGGCVGCSRRRSRARARGGAGAHRRPSRGAARRAADLGGRRPVARSSPPPRAKTPACSGVSAEVGARAVALALRAEALPLGASARLSVLLRLAKPLFRARHSRPSDAACTGELPVSRDGMTTRSEIHVLSDRQAISRPPARRPGSAGRQEGADRDQPRAPHPAAARERWRRNGPR